MDNHKVVSDLSRGSTEDPGPELATEHHHLTEHDDNLTSSEKGGADAESEEEKKPAKENQDPNSEKEGKKNGEKSGEESEKQDGQGDAEEKGKEEDKSCDPKRTSADIRRLEEFLILIAGSKDMLNEEQATEAKKSEKRGESTSKLPVIDDVPELESDSPSKGQVAPGNGSPKRKASQQFPERVLPYRFKPREATATDLDDADFQGDKKLPEVIPNVGSPKSSSRKPRSENASPIKATAL